eukprot:4586445-Prymnesium_polylepis.1
MRGLIGSRRAVTRYVIRPKLPQSQTRTYAQAAVPTTIPHDGLWPMMRRVAVAGAARALRC